MLIKKAKYSLYELSGMGVATLHWEQYFSEDQLTNSRGYTIGVISGWNNDNMLDAKKCETTDDSLKHIEFLQFRHGLRAIIILHPIMEYDYVGNVLIRSETDFEISENANDFDKTAVCRWVNILAKRYTFETELYLEWARLEGEIFVTEIY